MELRDIPTYEGLYAVTPNGQVWSHPKKWVSGSGRLCAHEGKFLSRHIHTGGYLQVNLTRNRQARMAYVHRLVAQTYVSNPLGLPEVNHKDTDKTNNHYTNLEWMTRKQNAQHAQLHNLYKHEPARGECHPDNGTMWCMHHNGSWVGFPIGTVEYVKTPPRFETKDEVITKSEKGV